MSADDLAARSTALKAQADRHAREAYESFERCDTDGFLSQWASGLASQRCAAEARLIEQGNIAEFLTLFDLDGNFVPAKIIQTQYGSRWMVLDAEGRKTGEFLTVAPVRRSTLAKHGYVEGYAKFPARVDYTEGRGGMTSVRVQTLKACRDHEPPTEIVTADRWTDDADRSAT
jgi:hypothetical protein